jgi:2-dehydro-3-deoxyphosphogalactonate aldolase
MNKPSLKSSLARMPLVAILRGITPAEIIEVGSVLAECGFSIIEVPLNSPDAFRSIELLARSYGDRILVGAGTVLSVAAVKDVADAGGRLIVAPNGNSTVIRAAERAGCHALPGVATPTEAFAALEAGADGLKAYPAEQIPPAVIRAWRAVLPPETLLLPVGGITLDNISTYWDAGASGFGLGSSLYRAGNTVSEVRRNAEQFAGWWTALRGNS